MPEYAQKTGKGVSGADAARAWIRPASRLTSSTSTGSRDASAQPQTLQAALNRAPAVQAVAQLKRTLNQRAQVAQRESIDEEELLQGKFETAQRAAGSAREGAPDQTGMPDQLKAGIESLSGMDLSDVRVHANSDMPAQLDALAYAQGSDIHLAPGQERHLPHEAWHVVQQRQGRVVPTLQMQGVNINDDRGLEAEADRMGAQASQLKKDRTRPAR